MNDLEEANRLLGECKLLILHYLPGNRAAEHIDAKLDEALALMDDTENKIKDLIADMDWRSLHNDAIILHRLKDIIPARTSDEETDRMKVRWKTKSPEEPKPPGCFGELSLCVIEKELQEKETVKEPEKEVK